MKKKIGDNFKQIISLKSNELTKILDSNHFIFEKIRIF